MTFINKVPNRLFDKGGSDLGEIFFENKLNYFLPYFFFNIFCQVFRSYYCRVKIKIIHGNFKCSYARFRKTVFSLFSRSAEAFLKP